MNIPCDICGIVQAEIHIRILYESDRFNVCFSCLKPTIKQIEQDLTVYRIFREIDLEEKQKRQRLQDNLNWD